MRASPPLSSASPPMQRSRSKSRPYPCWWWLVACAVLLATPGLGSAETDTDHTVDDSPHALRSRALERQDALLDLQLGQVQRNARLYLGSWIAINGALAGAQIAIALSSESEVVRSNYLVGAGLSAAGLVMIASQPWPGLRAHTRYARLPAHDFGTSIAKIARGERMLGEQRYQDRLAVAPVRHVFAAIIALGSGIRAGLSFEQAAQGVGRALFVLTVLELQLLTRPLVSRSAPTKTTTASPLVVVPWADRHAQGASLRLSF